MLSFVNPVEKKFGSLHPKFAMENQFEVENHEFDDDEEERQASGSESTICDDEERIREVSEEEFVKLDEDDPNFKRIKVIFMSNLGDLQKHTTIVDVRKKNWLSSFGQARLRCFDILAQSLANKRRDFVDNGDDKFVKYAWYGGSKLEIDRIMSHGFGHRDIRNNIQGIYLSASDFPAQSVHDCVVDDDGLRHVLLCRVIVGNTEFVSGDSSEFSLSDEDEFDSGGDGVRSPTNYIIWSNKMNTHILPEFVISFSAPVCLKGFSSETGNLNLPTSPWIPMSTLISELEKCQPPDTINSIREHYNELKEKRITRHELVKKVRSLVGDDVLLISIIKSFQVPP